MHSVLRNLSASRRVFAAPALARGFAASAARAKISKLLASADEAVQKSGIKTGDVVLAGGFGLCGMYVHFLTSSLLC